MKLTVLALAMAGALIAAGCAAEPKSGVVTASRAPLVGPASPKVVFTSAAGTETTINRQRQNLAIVAFTETPAGQCCRIDPRVLRLQDWSAKLPLTVVQISLPTAACPHGPGSVDACGVIETDVILLDDADRAAWTAYGRPAPGTAFLIGELNEIIERASLDDTTFLRSRAEELGTAILERYAGD